MDCAPGDALGGGGTGFFDFLGDPIGTLMRIVANIILAGAIAIFGELSESVPTLGPDFSETNSGVPGQISDQIEWVVTYLAIGSVLFAAAKMALDRKGEAGKVAIQGFLRVILVAGAGTYIAANAVKVSDDYSDHLYRSAALNLVKSVPCIGLGTRMEAFLLLFLAFLLLLSAIVHVLMLYIRLGVVTMLLGTLPMAAAASMTNWGTGWWRKHIGWLLAWLIYKPAVGLIMFSGSAMISEGNRTSLAHMRIAGVGVLLLSAIAMPALLKIIVPATAALGTSDPSGAAASSVVGGVASGAKKVAGSAMSYNGGSGPSGARGPGSSQGGGGGRGPSGGQGTGGTPGPKGDQGQKGDQGSPGSGASTGTSAVRAAGVVAGAATDAAVRAGRHGRTILTGSVEGADGNAGHNN
ncbi:hypothetical protein DDE19_08340 [Micromonospora ureilytica]|uniref:Uncharacterized protein n=1 Tax=Micromonospora ureilytica TaxID=709868 RepID=A0A3N9YFI5_9ACTN|nr:hypothetical protein [Micromonospora ureilytica]RQX18287.1 hypothetical protein DDE19_08340 [Micromonospora ureilytica]